MQSTQDDHLIHAIVGNGWTAGSVVKAANLKA